MSREEHPSMRGRAERPGALTVSLVSALVDADALSAAAALVGAPPVQAPDAVVDEPDLDGGRFARELADRLVRDAASGLTGNTVVALEAPADPLEIALVLEHAFEGLHRAEPAVAVRDLVTASSVEQIESWLLDPAGPTGPTDPTDQTDAPDQTDDTHDHDTAERLARLLEAATVIVLSDIDDVAPARRGRVRALLARLNPTARVVDPSRLAGLHRPPMRFAAGRARALGAALGWQLELSGRIWSIPAETAGIGTAVAPPPGIDAHVFRDPRPFHPERLARAVAQDLVPARVGRIVRSRGLIQLATRAERIGSWSIAGDVLLLEPTAMAAWDADSPAGQEIVFFGEGLRPDALESVLRSCLLTMEELAAGPEVWSRYADAFPEWIIDHHSH